MADPVIPALLTAARLAELLGISRNAVVALAKRGDVPAIRVGSRWRFAPEAVRAWLETGGTPRPAPKPPRRARRR